MNIHLIIKNIFILSLAAVLFSGCSAFRMRVANDFYEQNAYIDAIPVYKKVLSKQKNGIAMVRLADCLRQTNNPLEAEQWYKKVMNIRQQRAIDKLFYAQVLMMNGKYGEAKKWLEIYSHYTRSDFRLQKLIESCDSLPRFYRDTNRYQVEMLKLNTPFSSNFAPAFFRSGIVFSSDRENPDGRNIRNSWNGRGFTDLYYSKKTERGNWLDPELLRGEVNGLYHDGPASFNKDCNIMYITRNNYPGASVSLEKNKNNFNVLKVYKSILEGNGWKINGEMPFCSNEYSVGHASVNNSGTAIYFTSDMPWGYGGTDLYVVKWVNGRWSNPQNLGVSINSAGNEMFPFIQNDSVLYFSSDGNYGLGGLDIFQSFYDGSNWTEPLNLGYPINTSFDDCGFIIDSLDQTGYFSSNRIGGMDKIFAFNKGLPDLSVSGFIYESGSNKPLGNTKIVLKSKGEPDKEALTDQQGKFYIPLLVNRNYTLTVYNEDYYFQAVGLSTFGKRQSEGIARNFSLEPVILNKAVIWRDIGFEKKDYQIQPETVTGLEQLFEILSNNRGLQIEIASYTDSRGHDPDNITLTQRRADACMNFLISRGISASRLRAKGYGETRLLNNCSNGILCLDEEHAENNRIEIKVTYNQK